MNTMITIYHGSNKIIEKPRYGVGKPYNDYGLGFYCTKELGLAREWAVSEQQDGYANQYQLELNGLKVLDLSAKEYNILHWITILLQNRLFDIQCNFVAPVIKSYVSGRLGKADRFKEQESI